MPSKQTKNFKREERPSTVTSSTVRPRSSNVQQRNRSLRKRARRPYIRSRWITSNFRNITSGRSSMVAEDTSSNLSRFTPEELRKLPFNTVLESNHLFPPKREQSPPAIIISEEEILRQERAIAALEKNRKVIIAYDSHLPTHPFIV